jgi:NADH-quinone oxidoreductase subunit J
MPNVLPGTFFYVLAAIIVVGGIMTITRRSAIHSAIWLIVTLIGVAGLYLSQQAEFLAAVQVLLYIGGIMVLFLFVIMLVNLDEAVKQRQFNHQWTIAVACTLLLLAEVVYFLLKGKQSFVFPEPAGTSLQPNTQLIAFALYRDYMLPFEIASVLLLVAIIGAVILAKKEI